MSTIVPAAPADMNFIRQAWMRDVRDPAEVRQVVRDAVLARARIFVLRPENAPEDTIGGFIVLSPILELVHWCGVKRTWRGFGYGEALIRHASELGCKRFARYGSQDQKRWLENKGWRFAPRTEVLLYAHHDSGIPRSSEDSDRPDERPQRG